MGWFIDFVDGFIIYNTINAICRYPISYSMRVGGADVCLVEVKSLLLRTSNITIEDGWLVMDNWVRNRACAKPGHRFRHSGRDRAKRSDQCTCFGTVSVFQRDGQMNLFVVRIIIIMMINMFASFATAATLATRTYLNIRETTSLSVKHKKLQRTLLAAVTIQV